MNLEGKVAIVTGAGRGVGEATARLLAVEGAHVVVNDLDEAQTNTLCRALQQDGLSALACPGDITTEGFAEQLIEETLAAFGNIDIVINNAGYIWNGAMHNHSDEQFQAMLDVHVLAPFRILRAFAHWLRPVVRQEQDSGQVTCRKVVNISSVSGTRGAATQLAYASAKAAVTGMTKTLAKEWGRYNVTVNCVAFGHIETRLTQPFVDEPPLIDVAGRQHRVGLQSEMLNELKRSTPLQRAGQPEDAAGAIFLFCLPASDFVTGEVLTCAGGA